MAASEDFLNGEDYDISKFRDLSFQTNDYNNIIETAKKFRERIQRTRSFERLNAQDCIQAYSTQYVSTRGDLLLVQDSPGADYYKAWSILPYLSLPTTYPSYEWTYEADEKCPYPSGYNSSCKPDPNDWKPYGNTVQYCWSEKAKQNCQVHFSLYFAIIVVICNLVKVISMFMTFKTHKHEALITLGDAIESFLDQEDVTTRGLSIYPTDRIQFLWNREVNTSKTLSRLNLSSEKLLLAMNSKQWEPKRWYWGSAATRKRWALCFVM